MKPTFWPLALLLFISISCSSYQKVSLSNFKKYQVSYHEREDLQYILKKNKLHYADIERWYIINNFDADESEAYESRNLRINDNIVIPTGATGSCIHPDGDHFIIDFGKGVRVPFVVLNDTNRAKSKITVGERVYNRYATHRNSRLYFNTGGHKK